MWLGKLCLLLSDLIAFLIQMPVLFLLIQLFHLINSMFIWEN